MKLRNKKTGEIKEYTHTMTSYHVPIKGGYEIFTPWYPEEWEELEDVKEPLIKDEKIRKAVRAWAEANEFGDKMAYIYDADKFALSCWQASIEFNSHIGGLEDGKEYSFDELCGEEEE